MSKSDRKPVIAGTPRERALDVLSPMLFSLLLVAFYYVVPDTRMLFLALFPLGILSAVIVMLLRRSFALGPTKRDQKTEAPKNHLPHFTALLHLHDYDDSVPTGERTEEFEVVLGTDDAAAKMSLELPEFAAPEETTFAGMPDSLWGGGESDVVVIEENGDEYCRSWEDPEEDEEVVCKDDNYIDTNCISPSRLPLLKLKDNEINTLRKKIPLPPLEPPRDSPTPWSSCVLIGFDRESG